MELIQTMNDLFSSLLEVQEKFKSIIYARHELEKQKIDLERVLRNKENLVKDDVLNAVEDGKPKYSNDKKRELAEWSILKEDKEYQEVQKSFTELVIGLQKLDKDLEVLKHEERAMHKQADLVIALANMKR